MRSWFVALRIAKREAFRAKGRTLLIVAMITMPVLVLTFAAVSYSMASLTKSEQRIRELGLGTATVTWSPPASAVKGDQPTTETLVAGPTTEDLTGLLPLGSSVAVRGNFSVSMRTATGVGDIDSYFLDASNPLVAPMVRVVAGRSPAADNEVAVSPTGLARLGTTLGGSVTVPNADLANRMFSVQTYRVVEVVEISGHIEDQVLFRPSQAGDALQSWIVKTPAHLSKTQTDALSAKGFSYEAFDDRRQEVSSTTRGFTLFGIGTIVTGLGILEVVLLAGPAFAVGARRRRRDLALTAANGATPSTIRRIVLGDGIVSGAVAAVVGLTAGIAIAFATRGLVAVHLTHERPGGYRINPVMLVAIVAIAVTTGVLAALVPALTAGRQDVVSALAGRRGITRSSRIALVLGVIGVALGALIAIAGAYRTSSNIVLAGLVTGELGLVLCTPTIVGAMSRLGRFLPVPARIALRDTARRRSAAAPAISAVMAAVAGSVALTVYLGANDARDNTYQQTYPTGSISVFTDNQKDADAITAVLHRQLPTAAVLPILTPNCAGCNLGVQLPATLRCPVELTPTISSADVKRAKADRRCNDPYGTTLSLVIVQRPDDGPAALGLTDADTRQQVTDALTGGTMVVTDKRFLDAAGNASVERSDFSGNDAPTVRSFPTAAIAVPAGNLQIVLATQAELAAMGVTKTGIDGVLAVPVGRVTQAKLDAIDAALLDVSPNRSFVETGPTTDKHPVAIILAIAAAVIALGASAMSTGLAAADGRADLTTLAAVGASPRMRRQLSLSQSGVIAFVGSALGVIAGLGAAVAVLTGLNQVFARDWPAPPRYPIIMPWTNLLISLVVVPVIAMLGAGLLTRSRLPVERRAD